MPATKSQKSKTNSGNVIDFILLKRVLVFAKPYRKQFIIATISAILLSFLGPIRPMLINYAIDNYILIPNKEKLLEITTLLLGLLFFEGIIQFFYIYLSTWIGQHVIQDLRVKVFKHILSLKMKYFDNTPIGTLVTRSVSDIETIADIFSQGLIGYNCGTLKAGCGYFNDVLYGLAFGNYCHAYYSCFIGCYCLVQAKHQRLLFRMFVSRFLSSILLFRNILWV